MTLVFIGSVHVVFLGLHFCESGLALASCATLIIVGQTRIREAYHLNVRVDPKINAFLLMEKARTGMTIAEVVETVFREYQQFRKEEFPSLERRKE